MDKAEKVKFIAVGDRPVEMLKKKNKDEYELIRKSIDSKNISTVFVVFSLIESRRP